MGGKIGQWEVTLTIDARQEVYDGRQHRFSCVGSVISSADVSLMTAVLKLMEHFEREFPRKL